MEHLKTSAIILKKDVRTGGGYASHSGWLSIKVTTQLKTPVNSWEPRKTYKAIWYHPENNLGPIIDNLVQFEKDFNNRTKKHLWGLVGSGGVGVVISDYTYS